MNRQVLVFLALAVLVGSGIGLFLLTRPAPARSAPTRIVDRDPRTPPPETLRPKPSGASRNPRSEAMSEPADAPAPGTTLRVESDVTGALVFVDRKYMGVTPLTIPDVAAGTHQLNVSADGYDAHVESLDLSTGPHDVTVRFKQVRLDARLAVVHKHRMGSCRGMLVATPEGLRYETTNRDDGFSVPLAGLDELQVNYLEKVLRAGPINGRQYSFIAPDEDADALVVFARDVNHAREKGGQQ